MSNFDGLLRNISKDIAKHSPEILTTVGVFGFLTTAYLASKATLKANKLIESKVEENQENDYRFSDKLKVAWRCYIPSMLTAGLSIACIVGAGTIKEKRGAALAAAYAFSETALSEYKNKVIESIGEKKETEIVDSIAKDHLDRNPVSNSEVIFTNRGTTLCYDTLSGRYFKSDIESIRRAVNNIRERLLDEMYISLNDFYYEIGLSNISLGDSLGWDVNRGSLDIGFSSQLADDGTPCLVLEYLVPPKYDFN